jgi:hypothetical protein
MESTIRSRRKLLAGVTLAAPIMLAIGNSLFPKDSFQFAGTSDKAVKTLAATSAAPHRVLAASLFLLVGMAMLGAAFCAVASLVRQRGGATATAGATVGVIGALGGVLVTAWLGLSVYAASQADIPQDAKVGYLLSLLKGSHLGNIVGVPFLSGLVLGSVLLAAGLFRSGAVSRWLAAIFPVAVIFATVFAPQGIAGALMGLPLIVVLGLLARQISRDPSIAGTAATIPLPQAYAATTP